MESKTNRSVPDQPSTPAIPSTRRPRVREVSSRFMSPLSSSSSGDLHLLTNSPRHHQTHQNNTQRSTSAQRHRRQLKLTESDENRLSDTARSLDSPFPQKGSKNQSKPTLKENRIDTPKPTPMLPPPSRSRLNTQRLLASSSAATKLLHSSLSLSSDDSSVFRASLSCKNGVGGSCLPPVAPLLNSKQKKVLDQQADLHSLKLLGNRYLQWRFANANAEVKTLSQKSQAESMLYSLGVKMSEMSDSVQKKRVELQRLQRVKAVADIVESQIPSLEEWTDIEEDYLASLSETTQALVNASLRLPLDVDVKVDTKELAEALVVASKSMEGIMQHIGNFVPKTQEMDTLMSELARVSSIEKASVEECGTAVLKTHSSQIEECYLRTQLIQQHKKSEVQERDTTSA